MAVHVSPHRFRFQPNSVIDTLSLTICLVYPSALPLTTRIVTAATVLSFSLISLAPVLVDDLGHKPDHPHLSGTWSLNVSTGVHPFFVNPLVNVVGALAFCTAPRAGTGLHSSYCSSWRCGRGFIVRIARAFQMGRRSHCLGIEQALTT